MRTPTPSTGASAIQDRGLRSSTPATICGPTTCWPSILIRARSIGHLEKPSVISTVVIRFGIESKEGGDGGSARLLRRGWSAELAFGGGGPVGKAGLGGGLRAVPGRPGAGPEAFGAGEGRTATL